MERRRRCDNSPMHPPRRPRSDHFDRVTPTANGADVARREPRHWHLFCQVIDNWGDIGVSWRLASDLVHHGQSVTLWLDDASALKWMAPKDSVGIQVAPWPVGAVFSPSKSQWPDLPNVVIEMFGCRLSEGVEQFIGHVQGHSGNNASPLIWMNLEYLSAETHVHELHRLPSPVMSGPASGATKWFFYPGFSPNTGGLIHDHPAQDAVPSDGEEFGSTCSLFCYATPALADWVHAWQEAGFNLATWPGAGAHAVDALGQANIIRWQAVTQPEFDARLSQCMFNVVRGEDSLSRALWTGKPFLWHIYPQSDGAHVDKLNAFLDWGEAPEPVRQAHHIWNGVGVPRHAGDTSWVPTPLSADWPQWLTWAQAVQSKAKEIPNLTLSLIAFVQEVSTS